MASVKDEQSASALQEGWQMLPIFVLQISFVPHSLPPVVHVVGVLVGGAGGLGGESLPPAGGACGGGAGGCGS